MKPDHTMLGEILVLNVTDARIDARTGGELKLAIADLVAKGNRFIVIDLSKVSFIDSTGLGAIVSSRKLIGRQGDLVLCGLADSVSALLKLTRMDKVFRAFATPGDAAAAMSSTPLAAST
jgi:anti-sigma B factor antagonist